MWLKLIQRAKVKDFGSPREIGLEDPHKDWPSCKRLHILAVSEIRQKGSQARLVCLLKSAGLMILLQFGGGCLLLQNSVFIMTQAGIQDAFSLNLILGVFLLASSSIGRWLHFPQAKLLSFLASRQAPGRSSRTRTAYLVATQLAAILCLVMMGLSLCLRKTCQQATAAQNSSQTNYTSATTTTPLAPNPSPSLECSWTSFPYELLLLTGFLTFLHLGLEPLARPLALQLAQGGDEVFAERSSLLHLEPCLC